MENKKKLILNFSQESTSRPITSNLIRNYSLEINILRAEVDSGKEGHLLIEVFGDEETIKKGIEYLESENVEVLPVEKKIQFQEDRCVHCGACTAVCFSEALSMNRETFRMEFNPEKCIACGFCVDACPLQLFSLDFGTAK